MNISFRSNMRFSRLALLVTGFTLMLVGHAVSQESYDLSLKEKFAKRGPASRESVTAPLNDNFANAQPFGGDSGGMVTTNIGATGEVGEPYHGAGHGGDTPSQNNSVWFKWVAVVSRPVTLWSYSTPETPINDTVISVYTGSSVNALTVVAESDDFPGLDLYSKVTFTTTVGQTYYVAVDGYRSATGNFWFYYHSAETPVNDNFANAIDISAGGIHPTLPLTASNFGATSESGEPVHDATGVGTNNSVWYKWTSPQTRAVTFTLSGSAIDTVVAVYTGSAVNALTLVGRNDDYGPPGTFTSQVTFFATQGTTYRIAIDGYHSAVGNAQVSWNKYLEEAGKRFDFDGDLRSDISIFRPSNGQWWVNRSSASTIAYTFGNSTDRPTPGDFTGDGKVDVAVFRPSTGEWFILRSEDSSFYSIPFGTSGDVPVVGKFDNDDTADMAVFRPLTATWYIRKSRNSSVRIEQFGSPGDVPVPADYDGDGYSDIAIFRPSNGQWWLNRSTAGVIAATFGQALDKPSVGDYTGDGRSDIAFWRPSTGEWYTLRSEDSSYYSLPFGISSDLPAARDYNGDGRFDQAVFRPSTGTWYINASSGPSPIITQFGISGDRPTANSYIP